MERSVPAERGLPTVLVNAAVEQLGFLSVSYDAQATEQAVAHLLALGHERIGMVLCRPTTSHRAGS